MMSPRSGFAALLAGFALTACTATQGPEIGASAGSAGQISAREVQRNERLYIDAVFYRAQVRACNARTGRFADGVETADLLIARLEPGFVAARSSGEARQMRKTLASSAQDIENRIMSIPADRVYDVCLAQLGDELRKLGPGIRRITS